MAGAVYPQAAFELGHLYLQTAGLEKRRGVFFQASEVQRSDWQRTTTGRQGPEKALYAEAAFYAASPTGAWTIWAARWPRSSRLDIRDAALTSIYNNAGAISVQAARDEKKPEERARLLKQASNFLARAAESTPEDPIVRFNYAYALFLSGKYAEAADNCAPSSRPTRETARHISSSLNP